MYWMKNSEENYAAAIESLLNSRGFGVTTIHQVVIGSKMSVAQRLCHSAKPFGNRYFVVSTFFARCIFLTNNMDGEEFSFESLADMYEDKECKEILDRIYEDNLDELAKSLSEETHAYSFHHS